MATATCGFATQTALVGQCAADKAAVAAGCPAVASGTRGTQADRQGNESTVAVKEQQPGEGPDFLQNFMANGRPFECWWLSKVQALAFRRSQKSRTRRPATR